MTLQDTQIDPQASSLGSAPPYFPPPTAQEPFHPQLQRDRRMDFTPHPQERDREQAMKAAGIDRFTARQDALVKAGADDQTVVGRDFIQRHLLGVAEAVKVLVADNGKAGRKNARIETLGRLDPNLVAYLALAHTLNAMAGRKRKARLQHAVALKIGRAVYDELNWRHLQETDRGAFYAVKSTMDRFAGDYGRDRAYASVLPLVSTPRDTDAATVGVILLELLVSANLVEKLEEKVSKHDTLVEIVFTGETRQWLQERRQVVGQGKALGVAPVFAPMLEKPKPWTTPWDGGYRTLRLPLVKDGAKADYSITDMSVVYRSVNAMQDVAFRINQPIFNLVARFWREGVTAGKLPTGIAPSIPEKLSAEAWEAMTPEEHLKVRMERRELYEKARMADQQLASITQVLDMATEIGTQPFWLPYQLDFRGRVYAVPLLNHQGPDWMRAMMDFDQGKPLGDRGATWLGISLAGLWDGPQKLSKASFQDRYSWAESEETEAMVRSIVADPVADARWLQADKPWLFLRTAMDWVGYLDNGEDFVSHVAVALDGSCSGIQHYSAMLRDEVGGASVNLVPRDVPADVYGDVAAELKPMIDAAGDCPEKAFWQLHGLGRKEVKKPVMTYGYSSRVPGFTEWYETEYVRPFMRQNAALLANNGLADLHPNKAARWLAKLTLEAVEGKLVATAEGMNWLMTAAAAMAKQDTGIDWITPAGFPVHQEVRVVDSVRVETILKGQRIRVRVPGKPAKIDKTRMCSGIGPNFIHSMDAAHLMLCVDQMKQGEGVDQFMLIHDSFGTLAADTDIMFDVVRHTFVEMYEHHDPLADLYRSVRESLPPEEGEKLPPPPPRGSLDLSAVEHSLYCFA